MIHALALLATALLSLGGTHAWFDPKGLSVLKLACEPTCYLARRSLCLDGKFVSIIRTDLANDLQGLHRRSDKSLLYGIVCLIEAEFAWQGRSIVRDECDGHLCVERLFPDGRKPFIFNEQTCAYCDALRRHSANILDFYNRNDFPGVFALNERFRGVLPGWVQFQLDRLYIQERSKVPLRTLHGVLHGFYGGSGLGTSMLSGLLGEIGGKTGREHGNYGNYRAPDSSDSLPTRISSAVPRHLCRRETLTDLKIIFGSLILGFALAVVGGIVFAKKGPAQGIAIGLCGLGMVAYAFMSGNGCG